MSNILKVAIAIGAIIVIAGVLYFAKGTATPASVSTSTATVSPTPTSDSERKAQNYMNEFVQERKNLVDNFKPSPVKKIYASNNIGFEYPDNFIATSTASAIVLVTPPKIYEIVSHLETEFYLPALTIEFHKSSTSQELLNKDYTEYKSTARNITRNGHSVTQVKVINGFDGSEFIVEFFDTPNGAITASYLNEQFSQNFSTILDSIRS